MHLTLSSDMVSSCLDEDRLYNGNWTQKLEGQGKEKF